MLVIAIDPGSQGAMCSLDTYPIPIIHFQDCPREPKIDTATVYHWLEAHTRGARCIVIEDVHSMHNMTAKSNFQFGRNLGIVETMAKICCLDIEYLQPKTWQNLCGIKFNYPLGSTAQEKTRRRKATTASRCMELYTQADIYGPKGGLKDGRADALMIAHAMIIKLGERDALS